jgi:glucokinase-like ROK family protein
LNRQVVDVIRCAACCDVGGTKALLGLVDEEGNILARDRYLLGSCRDPKSLVEELVARLQNMTARAGLTWEAVVGVGCSAAVMADVDRGIIFSAPNMLGPHRDVPFSKMLQDAADRPAWIEMDAYAAAMGEAWKGVGRGVDYFTYVVVGTGIGAGILMRGQVYRGWRGTAGEFGHITIDPNGPLCNCGRYGCLEALAAGPAIAERARAAILQGRRTAMPDLAGNGEITAKIVFDAARQGDEVARYIVHQVVEYLALGLTNLIHLLNPQVIGLGGGVVRGGVDLLLDPLRHEVAQRCGSWVDMEGTRIVLGSLGEDASLLGAARRIWKSIEE